MANLNLDPKTDIIATYAAELSEKEKDELIKAFRLREGYLEAKRINSKVKPNNITVKEICDIVNKVRKQNAA